MSDNADRIAERAGELFVSGHHCSEAVVIAVGDHLFGKCPEVLIRASDPFGGGVALTREELCGVLSGGVMILGALRGRMSPTEDDKPLYALVARFRERFLALAGSTQCQPIFAGYPEKHKRCQPIVVAGTKLLMEMLEERS